MRSKNHVTVVSELPKDLHLKVMAYKKKVGMRSKSAVIRKAVERMLRHYEPTAEELAEAGKALQGS